MKGCDQRIFGKYDNRAIQQLCADAYGLPESNEVEVRVLNDILNLPLPPEPTATNINIAPAMAPTPDHPDELLSQNLTQPSYEIENDNMSVPCKLPLLSAHGGGASSVHGGGDPCAPAPSPPSPHDTGSVHCGGAPTSHPRGGAPAAGDALLVGELRPTKRARFTEAPPPYGTPPPPKWWEC
mmetsp:Transcript_61234/g.126489  ORF Transcript_61234/g.126489 Transcript_61234/m.126489 type:complete len:182 (-) Transcript_61234:3948-4493(-)